MGHTDLLIVFFSLGIQTELPNIQKHQKLPHTVSIWKPVLQRTLDRLCNFIKAMRMYSLSIRVAIVHCVDRGQLSAFFDPNTIILLI